jgi:hypothetical protein
LVRLPLNSLIVMKMCVYLLFDAPSAVFTPPTQRQASGLFRSTRGSAETWLSAAQEVLVPNCEHELKRTAEQHLTMGKVSGIGVWSYFFGIVVAEIILDVPRPPSDAHELALWDECTDAAQKDLEKSMGIAIGYPVTAMWTTVLLLSEEREQLDNTIRPALSSLTKVKPVDRTGFVSQGLAGIGMSWVEVTNDEIAGIDARQATNIIIATERDAISYCAGVYCLYDDVIADYGTWLAKRSSRRRSHSAAKFRYVASVRVHHNLHLGPNERGVNDTLWEVWGMPAMVRSLEASVERLEADIRNSTLRAAALSQTAFAIGAAVIAVLVGVSPVRSLLGLPDTAQSSWIVLSVLVIIEASLLTLLFAIARWRRR